MLGIVLKRAGGLGVGTAIGQGIILLATPWLVRLYGPFNFGILALLLTVTNIGIVAGCARFDMALPSSDDADLAPLARLCVLIAGGGAITVTIVARLIAPMLSESGALHELVAQPVLLGLCVLFAAVFQAMSSVLLRRGAVSQMAILRIVQGALFVALALWSEVGLLWAQVLSYAPACILLPTALRVRPIHTRVSVVAAKYRAFALLGLPGAALDVVGYSLCIWIVTFTYGATGSGELSQVQRIVGAPLMLVSMSLGQVLLRQSAEMWSDLPRLRLLVLRLLGLMALAAGGALAMLTIFGKPVLDWILGSKWNVSTSFIVAVSAAVFIRAIVSPISAVLATARRFDLAIRWQFLYFMSASILFIMASRSMSLDNFVIFYALHEIILYFIYLRIIMIVLKKA